MACSWKPQWIYHIFLSFRGSDVRNNFIDHLYRALDLKGIYTFIDSEELRKGDQIWPALEKAIEKSRIAIIVFSEDYASSSWCLDEVAKIMECKEKRDLTVFPVFYKVEPREVRTPRTKYRDAMDKHELKFGKNSEKVKQWKEALSKAGSLSGWHLKDGDDLEHTQIIVKQIATHLGRTPLQVAKHPVAIDSRVVKLKSMLNLKSNDGVLMAGLWGKGGIGKTTLAKAIYNYIFTQFEGSCFLANVREDSKDCKDLVTLQEKLLSEILLRKQELVVSTIDVGTILIRERLRCKKVLLILDDVDDLRQLNALAGEGNWFGNGSRIIFTTRDEHLLTAHGIDHVYEVKELHHKEAHELLSKHAFPTHQKLEIKTHLVDDVLNYAKGLPLALEVLGSLLCGRTEHEWKSTLNKLSKIPSKSINDVLKISYDGLEYNEKEIFLHIACFFKGQRIEYIKKVLDSCDFDTEIGLKILIERSLIKIGFMTPQMHDLIHLMGTDIVKQECRDDPRRRSRLWLYDDFLDVLSYDMEDCEIKAIVLEPPELKELSICPNAFTKMKRLRLLILRNVRNSFQDPMHLPNWLRWWEWPGAPWIQEFSPSPKKLVGLDMSKSMITIAPKQFKDFQNLMYINFSDCNLMVHMPDFSCTPNLKELNFAGCKNLVEAHESIAYLDKLEVLRLDNCSELSVFPNVLNSKNLRQFNFSHTKFERFPDIPHILKGFKNLYFHMTAIKEIPTSIENLVALETMNINCCENLKCLPSSIYKLQNLKSLDINNCPNLIGFPKYEDSAYPCMKAGLSNLRYLTLRRCNMFELEFLENPSYLPLLNYLIIEENNITTFPTSINKRDSLSWLSLLNCHQLQEIPELPPFLKHFFVTNCESLQKKEDPIPIHHIVRAGSTISDERFEDQPQFLLPQGEMPQWIFPIEEDSIIFEVSKDLYDKIIGVAHCVVLKHDEKVEKVEDIDYYIYSYVNGEQVGGAEGIYELSDMGHVAIEYSREFWEKVDFVQIAGRYIEFGVKVKGTMVKKWGFRIICKQLGDDLKAELRDNQLIDLALIYEIGHGSTDLAAESSHVHEDNLREANLQEDLQDCQMSTGKHTQIVSRPEAKRSHMHGHSLMEIDLLKNFQDCQMSVEEHSQRGLKRKHELILPQGWLHL